MHLTLYEKFPLVYESDNTRDSLYEKHGATLSTSVELACPFYFFIFFLFFFLVFSFPFFSIFFSFFVRSLIPTCGGIIVSIILSSLWHALIMDNDDHHTSIYLQLNTTTIVEQSMTLYECNDLA